MKKALLLVSILFISVISTACINNFAVQELNNKAKDSMDNGDYMTAIGRLKSSIDLDASLYETHYNLGVAYTKAEDYANAVTAYNDALKLNPEFADAYYSIAVAQENLAKDLMNGVMKIDKTNQLVKVEQKDLDNLKDFDNEKELGDGKSLGEGNLPEEKTQLTQIDKDYIIELLDSAIKNYDIYLTKNISSEEKTETQNSISELQNIIDTYKNGGDPLKPTQKSDKQTKDKFVIE